MIDPRSSPVPRGASTALTPPPAEKVDPYDARGQRRPGVASGFAKMLATPQEYTPPDWSTKLLYHAPQWGGSIPGEAQSQRTPMQGIPTRATVDLMGDDALKGVLGAQPPDDPFMVGLGAQPGQQRGGFYNGIATTPITMANFATYGRERLLALLGSAVGADWQQPEQHGMEPELGSSALDRSVGAVREFGNAIDAPFRVAHDWWFGSNNFNRAKSVRDLALKGETTPFLIDGVTSAIFGGSEKFTYAALAEKAAAQGVDVIDAISTAYDMDPRIVSAILSEPSMTDEKLGELMQGQPISLEPWVALASEAAFFGGTLAVGFGGLKLVGTGIKMATSGTRIAEVGSAVNAAFRGRQLAEGASATARLAGGAGTVLRGAAKINALNTSAGWTITGFEWGIKQMAGIAGNKELADAMDRLMWQMPLSMNPGLNLLDGYSIRPLRTGEAIGRTLLGRPRRFTALDKNELSIGGGQGGITSPGSYVGGIGVDEAGRYIRIGGREMRLGKATPAAEAVQRIETMTPDDMHANFFSKAGFERGWLEMAFGDGNKAGLSWDDLRNTLLYLALQSVRESKGNIGRMFGLNESTLLGRSEAFVKANLSGALRVLESNLDGRSTSMTDQIRGQFWRLAELNDSEMAGTKARLTDTYIPELAFKDFVSFVRASNTVRTAIAEGRLPATAVVRYRRDVNLEYIGHYREHLAVTYKPGEVVRDVDVELLKRYGGAIESRGLGGKLRRRNTRATRARQFTRSEIEQILDDVERKVRAEEATATRAEAPSYRDGDTQPGEDPFADQRVLGLTPAEMQGIEIMRTKAPSEVRGIPGAGLLAKVAQALGRTPADLAAMGPQKAWDAVFQWYDDTLAAASETAFIRTRLDDFATQVRGRSDITPGEADVASRAVAVLRSELTSPITDVARRKAPAPAARWDRAAEQARVAVNDLEAHLKDDARNLRAVRIGDETWAVPATVNPDILVNIDARAASLAANARVPMGEAERALLRDTTVPPLEKLDTLIEAMDPRDLPQFVQELTEAGVTDGIWGDLRAIVGEGSSGEVARKAGTTAASYATRTRDHIATLDAAANAFRTVDGTVTPEVAEAVGRAEAFQSRRSRTTGNRRYNVMREDLDPTQAAQRAYDRGQAGTIGRIRRRVEAAKADVAAAQRGMTPEPGLRWEDRKPADRRGFLFPPLKGEGGTAKAEAMARAFADDLRRQSGLRNRVIKRGNGFIVQEEVPFTPPGPEPVRNAATVALRRYEAPMPLDDIRAIDNRLESSDDPTAFEGTAVINRLVTADDAYLNEVRAYSASRADALRGEGVEVGQNTSRALFLGELDDRVRAIDRLLARPQQARLEEAAVLQGAPQDFVDRVVAGREGEAGVIREGPSDAEVLAADQADLEPVDLAARLDEGAAEVDTIDAAIARVEAAGTLSDEATPKWETSESDLRRRGLLTGPADEAINVQGGEWVLYDADGNAVAHAGVALKGERGGVMYLSTARQREGLASRLYDAIYDAEGDAFLNAVGGTKMSPSGKAFVSAWLKRLQRMEAPLIVVEQRPTRGGEWQSTGRVFGTAEEAEAFVNGRDNYRVRPAAEAVSPEPPTTSSQTTAAPQGDSALPGGPAAAEASVPRETAPDIPPEIQTVMDAAERVRQTGEGWQGYLDEAEVERILRNPGYGGQAKADVALAMEERIRAQHSPDAIEARENLPPGVRPATSNVAAIYDESLATLGDVLGREMADLDAKRWAKYMKALTPEERAIANDLRTRMRKFSAKDRQEGLAGRGPEELRAVVKEADDLRHQIWEAAGWNGRNRLTPEEVASWGGVAAAIEPEAAPIYGVDTGFPDADPNAPFIPARFRVVDIDELQVQGADSPLQPRDRSGRKTSEVQVEQIGREFRPELAFRTESGAHGPQVVTGDLRVVAGNGRTMAMRSMTDEQWATYKTMLIERAAETGIDPASVANMQRPVLVREIPDEYATPQTAAWLNAETGAMAPAEMAVSIARQMSPEDIAAIGELGETVTLRDALIQPSKAPFVQRVLGILPEQQRAPFMDAQGNLSAEGAKMLSDALLARMVQAPDVLARLVEHPEVGTRFRNALEMSLGQVLVAEQRLQIAGVAGAETIGAVMGDAMRIILGRLEAGMTIRDLRGDLMTESLFEFTRADGLARALALADNQNEMASILRGYARATEAAMQQGMFDAGIPSLSQRINAGIDDVNAGRMLDKIPRMPEEDGTTIHPFTGTDGVDVQARSVPVVEDVAQTIEANVPPGRKLFVGDDYRGIADYALRHPGEPIDIQTRSMAEAEMLRDFLAGDDVAYRDTVRVEQDGTLIDEPGEAPPEWWALRGVSEGREMRVYSDIDSIPPEARSIIVRNRPVEPTTADLGFTPDMSAERAAMESRRDSGRPVAVDPTDLHTEAVAQAAVGAPLVREGKVIVMNEPDVATQARLRQEALDSATQRLTEAEEALEAARNEAGIRPELDALDPDTLELWHRYYGGDVHPTTIGEVLQALESLDHGVPPQAAMAPADLTRLRGSLLAAYHKRLDQLGAERVRPTEGETRVTPNRWQDPARMAQNDELGDDLRYVTDEIQRRIVDDDAAPLDGWEGTQYEVVRAPKTFDETGRPLSPRILYDDYLAKLDDVVPGLHDEIMAGRRPTWENRTTSTRIGNLLDMVVGGRAERELGRRAIDNFREELTAWLPEGASIDDDMLRRMDRQISGLVGYWHEQMVQHTVGLHGRFEVNKYRRVGQVPRERLQQWAEDYFKDDLPAWWDPMMDNARAQKQPFPIAEAWRKSDNRIRQWFADRPGPIAQWVEKTYAGRRGQQGHDWGRGLSVAYNTYRFALDLRWLALEATDAFALTLGKWGPEGLAAARNASKDMPLMFGPDDLARQRTSWAWWLSVMDTGGWNRSRERYILGHIKRQQERDFPDVMRAMAEQDPMLRQAIDAWDGGDTRAWLQHLAHDLNMMAERGRYASTPAELKALTDTLQGYLDRGVITQVEFDDSLKRGYWTDMPALEKELSWSTDPVYSALIERLTYVNQQAWQDAASLIFGQTDRSNLQRLMNSPLLYWPISYQIKATKWLASMLLDQAFGYRTGALGAVTLGTIHEQHKEWMATVPAYAEQMSKNRQLMFLAQMILPITPWDLGVALSPYTRLALDYATGGEVDYQRNIFSVGPGYTMFELMPNLLREQSREGALAQGVPLVGGIVREAQRFFPYRPPAADPVGLAPAPNTSQLQQAAQQQIQGATVFEGGPVQPDTRFGP
jgi:hypothetical protein